MENQSSNNENPSFVDKFKMDLSTLWKNHKAFFIIFGVLVVAVQFREVIIDFLVSDSKNLVKKTEEKDQELKKEEKELNDKADQLVKEAKELDNQNKPVDEDWYKKWKKLFLLF